jgi:hypothetical protein
VVFSRYAGFEHTLAGRAMPLPPMLHLLVRCPSRIRFEGPLIAVFERACVSHQVGEYVPPVRKCQCLCVKVNELSTSYPPPQFAASEEYHALTVRTEARLAFGANCYERYDLEASD